MRRREFLILAGGGVALSPLAAFGQSTNAPVIGFLNSGSAAAFVGLVDAFRRGLSQEGYVEGRNVQIEFRWAGGQYDLLPSLANDLVRRGVALIAATGGIPSARAAKAATTTIPILFVSGSDPVVVGLVASLNRPGGNATGVSVVTTDLVGKRLEWLRRLLPRATTIAMLVNPGSYSVKFEREFASEMEKKEAAAAAVDAGLTLFVVEAGAEHELEAAFGSAKKLGADAFLVSADPFFTDRRDVIVTLAERYALPAIYPWRQYAVAGGLMSYGPSITEVYRQIGGYAGRILKGAKPIDLPVQKPSKFELVINRKTAKALGLDIAPELLTVADEVIE
jgi:putative ABC transport system substrate-binding protein